MALRKNGWPYGVGFGRAALGDVYKRQVEVEPLPADTTGPNLILTPHRDAQKSGSGTGSVVNLEEEL